MTIFRAAFGRGTRAALNLRVLAPLYLWSLLLGLIQTWPLWSAGSAALRNPFLSDLTAGDLDALVNVFLGNASASATAGIWSFFVILLAAAGGIGYAFFAGGLISTYAERGSFWAACRRFFWSFVALGTLLFVLAGLVVGVAVALTLAAGGLIGTGVALVGLWVINTLGEYARAVAVMDDRRNPFVVFGRAITLAGRKLGGVLAFALLGTLLVAALSALYLALANLIRPSPLLVVWQQLCVFGLVWIKGLRLAWATHYVDLTNRSSGRVAPSTSATATSIPTFDQG